MSAATLPPILTQFTVSQTKQTDPYHPTSRGSKDILCYTNSDISHQFKN